MKYKATLGIPNMEIFWISTRSETFDPSDGHVWFSPIIPRDGNELLKCQNVYMDLFSELNMESPITPFSHPRSWMYRAFCLCLLSITHAQIENIISKCAKPIKLW